MNEILGGTASTEDERHYLWHCNGLRRDLMALTTKETPTKQADTLENYLQKIVDVEGSVAAGSNGRASGDEGHDDVDA